MKRIVYVLALACAPCFAVPTFKGHDLTVRLFDTPCSKPVADLIQPQFVERFRSAVSIFGKREIPACWTLEGNDVVIVDADGDGGKLPALGFHDEPAI